jgi:septum formation protein
MKEVGLEFQVIPSGVDEASVEGDNPAGLVTALARAKAEDVASRVPEGLVVGADTIVVVDGAILGKPRDAQDAARMLRMLAGRAHEVYSGVAVVDAASGRCVSGHEVTEVRFRPLTDRNIENYLATGEPWDKAGAYAIQGVGSLLVSGITGDYTCVVGLPLGVLSSLLREFGLELI